MLRKLLLMVFFLIAFVALASASNDFFAYSDSAISVCCGEVVEKPVFITNGDFDNIFVIEKSGTGSDFIQVYPTAFELRSGEQAVVSEFIKAPCGNYDVQLSISTDTNLLKVLKQEIVSSPCNNVGIKLVYRNDTGCRCNVLAYVFNVSNTGSYEENYFFSVDTFSDYAVFVPESIRLPPAKSTVVNLLLVPDCSDLLGDFSFVVMTEKSNFAIKYPLSANINSSCKTNMPLYQSKSSPLSKYLVDSLLFFPIVIILLAVILFLIRKFRQIKPRQAHYPWERRFSYKEGVKPSYFRTLLWIAALFVIVALIVFFLFKLFLANGVSPLLNVSQEFTKIPEPVSEVNITDNADSSGIAGWISDYFVYFLVGIVVLVAIIAAIELFRLRKETKKN